MTPSDRNGLDARVAGPPREADVGPTEARVREVVEEFYRRARADSLLGPIFADRIAEWDGHLARMVDFWSAVMRGTGRYRGRPLPLHRAIDGLSGGHFDRWIELFDATTRDVCPPDEAAAFLGRALHIREAMTKVLELGGAEAPAAR
ncbi:group III truncated hemoglobin [Paludisphaera soli]|uniref:group III truncated hemoglobin n=1 Tax=Paludisphaera soli TaxID=2712865 RepID=UPI0013EA6C93|nr:group III truncated hemoglobin [Paludisphaera soli]